MGKPTINYLYFGIYFLFLSLLSFNAVFTKENLGGSSPFFFLYALGQIALETSLLVFLGIYIQKWLGNRPFQLFLGLTFVFLLLHIADFLMDHILDLSVWETLRCFVFDEDWASFIYLLDASGISLWIWTLLLLLALLVPLLGIIGYRITHSLIRTKPLYFAKEPFLLSFLCIPCALLFWDFSASLAIPPDAYTHFLQALPWKNTFLSPKSIEIPLASPWASLPSEKQFQKKVQNIPLSSQKHLPNIYLFIAESLRRDMITEKIAPHFHQFSQQALPIDRSLSNANGTNLSWFSIFHSQFAHHWSLLKERGWKMGSPPLALLKQWGYQIRVYSSAELGYYGLEGLLFGKNCHLLSSYKKFHVKAPLLPADGDALALKELQTDLANDPKLSQGNVFIVFWDASHFDYSWGKEWTPPIASFAEPLSFFKAFYSNKTVELIKNRYQNAIAYLDSLFGSFYEKLPHKEEAIVIFTGDHGEEFFERGHLFHNSHLTKEQTEIPLWIKLGSLTTDRPVALASQIDIFPSILHAISGQEISLFEGRSLLGERKEFSVISRFNASRAPYEFCIHNGTYKCIARFSDKYAPFQSNELLLRSLKTAEDDPLFLKVEEVTGWIEREFGSALTNLRVSRGDP